MSPLSFEWTRKADAAITTTRPWVAKLRRARPLWGIR